MVWIEICMNATDEAIDWICTALSASDAEIRIASLEVNSDWGFQVQLYLEETASRSQVDQITTALMPLHRTGLISAPETYLTDEKPAEPATAQVQQIGRFVLVPPHFPALDSSLAADQIPLYLRPSPAFGQGSHPATRLALQLLEGRVTAGMHCLDLGTGTGILGVAMAKLGAAVLALDNDPAAIRSAEAAVRLNQVTDRVTVKLGSLGRGSELGHWMGGDSPDTAAFAPIAEFDLIAANILARIHIALAADYGAALKPNGILITAGFTSEFEPEIESAFAAAGFELIKTQQFNEWRALMHQLR